MDWAQILVFILATLFIVFLVIAIVLVVLLLRVSRQIKSATSSAEKAIQAVEKSTGSFGGSALPAMAVKSIYKRVNKPKVVEASTAVDTPSQPDQPRAMSSIKSKIKSITKR